MNADVIILGGGVDELVAAQMLARARRSVVVLDPLPSRDAGPHEGWVPDWLVRALSIDQHGLNIHAPDPWAEIPLAAGGRLKLWRSVAKTAEAIRAVSERDAARWPAFCARLHRMARMLGRLYAEPPPDPMGGIADLAALARQGLNARLLGRRGLEDLLRLPPMPIADLLDDEFESEALKGLLAACAVHHLAQGPRSAGTTFSLLHRHAGAPPGVFIGSHSNLASVLGSTSRADIRYGAGITAIRVERGRACGVTLSSGETIDARLVLSGLDPARTLCELLEPGWIDPALLHRVRHIRRRGVMARIVVTSAAPVESGTFVIATSPDYVERAADAAKHGSPSAAPVLEVSSHPGEDGAWRIHVDMQYAPYSPTSGWTDSARKTLCQSAARALEEHGVRLPLDDARLVVPLDFEALDGWPQGQARHAEVALDQFLWMRPVPELARYATPVKGLYLCGPAMHPGIAGACGYHAARRVIADRL